MTRLNQWLEDNFWRWLIPLWVVGMALAVNSHWLRLYW